MAITVGTSEPTSFTIGDTVSWTRHEADYLAPTWNLVWGFSGPTRFTVVSTDYNTTDHKGTMPTTGLKPGKYTWTVKATDGSQSITLESGETDALPDLTSTDTELDAAEAQQTLVETAYNALATGKNVTVTVDGVTYTRRDLRELKAAMLYARRETERLRNIRRSLLGQSTGNTFRVRFLN